jgi:hypothetical protein
METDPLINEPKQAVLTPVNEFLSIIQKRYNSSPNSLAAGGYREVLKMAEQFTSAEVAFANAAYTAGYEQAIADIREAQQVKPENEKEAQNDPE